MSLLYSHCNCLDLFEEPNHDMFVCAEQNLCEQPNGAGFNLHE